MADPDDAVLDRLITQSVITAKGTDGLRSPERPYRAGVVAHKVIFAWISGGRPPQEYVGQSVSTFRRTHVAILVRGNPGEEAATRTFARAAWTALQGLDAAELTGYVNVFCLESEPTRLMDSDGEEPRWRFTVEMWHGGT